MTISAILKTSNFIKLGLVLFLSGVFFWLSQEVSQTYDLQKNFYSADALISELRVISDSKYRLLSAAAQAPVDGQLEEWEALLWREDGSHPRPSISFLAEEKLSMAMLANEVRFLDGQEKDMLYECLKLNEELSKKGKEALMLAHGISRDQHGKYTVLGTPQPEAAQRFIKDNNLEQIPAQIVALGRKLRSYLYADFRERMADLRTDLSQSVGLAGLLLIVISTFISATIIFFQKRVSIPLSLVSRYAEDVAEDKKPEPLSIPHDDELSRLYVCLEKMKYALTQRIQAIDEARRSAQVSHEQALQAKAQTIRALHKAQIMARTQEDFLRRISHEIRTPLNAIIGMSYLCLQTRLDHGQRDYLDKINEAGNSLLAMFNRMLDFSSVAEGNMQPEYAVFPLPPFLERMQEQTAPKAAEKQLQFVMHTADDLPASIYGDEGHLEEVLRILLDNALKFTEQGKVEFACELTAGGLLRFSVSDTGPGISDNVRESIFAPYQEGSRAGEDINQGLGLGLALANSLVTLMGSTLTIESTLGEGSRFSFELPFRQEGDNAAPRTEDVLDDVKPERAPIVLVVDDNDINLQIDAELLEQAGITPVLVTNGQEAVDYMRDNEADLVLMDMQMPVMDGIEATKHLREMGFTLEALPILAMTAHTDEGSRKEGQVAGMNDYLTKPIDPQLLYERLAHWLPKAHIRIPGAPDEKAEVLEAKKRLNDAADVAGDYINIKAGLSRLAGNEQLYHDLLRHFAERYTDSAAELAGLLQSDMAEAARLVHTLKGTSANLGMEPLHSVTVAIEEGLPDTMPTDELLARFGESLEKTIAVIAQLEHGSDGPILQAGTAPLAEDVSKKLHALLQDLPRQVERDWGNSEEALANLVPQINGTVHAEAFGRVLKAVNGFDMTAVKKESWQLAEQLQTKAA